MINLLADENISGLAHLPRDEVCISTKPGRELVADDLRDVDALWVRSVTRVNAALLEGSRLSFVGTATAGLDHIDRGYLSRKNIPFAAAPGANANAVAEYVLAALLALGEPWDKLEEGGSLGIVGYGAVGRRLGAVAEHLGWSVRVYDPYVEAEQQSDSFHTLEAVLACEVISLHPSLARRGRWPSYHLFDRQVLARLDGRQTLINASRGSVVDNSALLERFRAPNAPAVILDVWEPEPLFDAQLLDCEALRIATPHIAGYSWHAKLNATRMLWAQMQAQGLVTQPLAEAAKDQAFAASVPSATSDSSALMASSYRILEDDARLRALKALPDAERGPAFDRLRKEHPARYEVAAIDRNNGEWLTGSARRLWEALRVGKG